MGNQIKNTLKTENQKRSVEKSDNKVKTNLEPQIIKMTYADAVKKRKIRDKVKPMSQHNNHSVDNKRSVI